MNNLEEVDLTQFLPEEALAEYKKEENNLPPATDETSSSPKVTLPPPPIVSQTISAPEPNLPPSPPIAPPPTEKPKSPLDSIPTLIVNEKGETEHLTLKHVLDKYYPPEPKKKTRNHILIGFISFLVFGLIVLSSSIALAENGYFQSFSAIYRQTKIPLIWKGTNGNFEALILKSYNLLNQKKTYKVDLSATATVEDMGNKTSLTVQDQQTSKEAWKQAINKLTDLKKLANGLMVKKFAVIDSNLDQEALNFSDQSSSDSTSFKSYLPITVSASAQEKVDGNNNHEANLNLDITDLVSKFPEISYYTDGNNGKINLSAILIDKESKAYFKHNLNLFKSEEQIKLGNNAWLAIENTNQLINEVKKENAEYTEITPENYKENEIYKNNEPLIKALIGKIQDKGIERVDGKALAHFQGQNISLDDIQKEISGSQPSDNSNFRTILNLDLWVNPKTAELDTLNLTVIVEASDINARLTSTFKLKNYSIDKINKIVAPSGSTVIPFDINKGLFGS